MCHIMSCYDITDVYKITKYILSYYLVTVILVGYHLATIEFSLGNR